MIYAAHTGEVETARVLLDSGASIEAKKEGGFTPLLEAAWVNRIPVAQLLVSRGADINSKTERNNLRNYTALHIAASKDFEEMVRFLLDQGADWSAKIGEGDTALDVARRNGRDSVIKLLVKKDFARSKLRPYLGKLRP